MKTACYVLFISACHTGHRAIKAQQRPSSSLHHHRAAVECILVVVVVYFYRKLLFVRIYRGFSFSFWHRARLFPYAQSSSDCTGNRNNIIIVNFPRLDFVVFIHFCFFFSFLIFKKWNSLLRFISFACPIRFFH